MALIWLKAWAMGRDEAAQAGEAMRILFFGRLGEQLGSELEIDSPGESWTIAELRESLCSRSELFREALGRPGVRACVDQVIVPDDVQLRPGQEVAFIPPLSGG
ncbi:MoaD/ThiS family protein [Sphingosinicella humi]|uniref:Molybdopterin synthase sulfur carrier subunit n=1 Tax=Allosphingosinicella humi TaxID=2068657 RepID=A0A2U2J082_9SPHN|nr:MoaD/ThiS family protein [Sphingosinicella humi]PWG01742.1 molybdopterin synthase sulfur carrier subunit [Sphingosinicella humi]